MATEIRGSSSADFGWFWKYGVKSTQDLTHDSHPDHEKGLGQHFCEHSKLSHFQAQISFNLKTLLRIEKAFLSLCF